MNRYSVRLTSIGKYCVYDWEDRCIFADHLKWEVARQVAAILNVKWEDMEKSNYFTV